MKTRLLGALVGLAISFALPTFAQQKKPVNPRLIREANDFNKKYCEAVNNHDAAAIGAMYTEDAIAVTDTGPLYGRQAIDKFYADVFKGWQPKNHTATIDPHSFRLLGPDYLTGDGDWSETRKGKNGEDVPIKGYWQVIMARQGEADAWKICRTFWNLTPAP